MSNVVEDRASQIASPWLTAWPVEELQQVGACPVCAATARDVLYEKLVDNVFLVAAGQWTLYRCIQCRSAYLDPRPNEASIGKAYGSYYTHEAGKLWPDASALSFLRRLKLSLFNGYINQRYGTQRLPANKSGAWALALLPRQKQRLDVEFRYLPKPAPGQTLLDIGCGNGDFLANAKAAGWHVVGVDPDPKAVDVALRRGLDVSIGSMECFDSMSNCFDAITLSHVLEHVHDPHRLIRGIHRLLKPGGVVYIDTPNIGSQGATLWQANWRGLETPRHLVLFSLGGFGGAAEDEWHSSVCHQAPHGGAEIHLPLQLAYAERRIAARANSGEVAADHAAPLEVRRYADRAGRISNPAGMEGLSIKAASKLSAGWSVAASAWPAEPRSRQVRRESS